MHTYKNFKSGQKRQHAAASPLLIEIKEVLSLDKDAYAYIGAYQE